MKLGMVGLGRMGANMAIRLLEAGHEVVVFDRHPEKACPQSPQGTGADVNPCHYAWSAWMAMRISRSTGPWSWSAGTAGATSGSPRPASRGATVV